MFQGTSSDVGKSVLATALCRILVNRGHRVAPFKSQNMALNSFVTLEGLEMGRAQVAQAEAARIEPWVEMNPILLKPTGHMSSQVVLKGKAIGTYSAMQYHKELGMALLSTVVESLETLHEHFDYIVMEGAGSPVEMNLKERDIVNMKVAMLTNSPVILVADIDRGGAIASIVGTLTLLEKNERDLVKGILINKFRGDIKLLEPALTYIEEYTGIPVIGVIPYIENIQIESEDSVALNKVRRNRSHKEIRIGILQLPRISNFTDFDALEIEEDVEVLYIKKGMSIPKVDALIIPGTKNTLSDLSYIEEEGYIEEIQDLYASGVPIVGICGGYQILGDTLLDIEKVEGDITHKKGLGLIPMVTTMSKEKMTKRVKGKALDTLLLQGIEHTPTISGYEIHMGRSEFLAPHRAPFLVERKEGWEEEGYLSSDGLILGTYIHGIFDNDIWRRDFINSLRRRKGMEEISSFISYAKIKDDAYERLASIVEKHVDMDAIWAMLGERDV